MTEKTRRDPRITAGVTEDLSLDMPKALKKIPDTVPVAARIPRELWHDVQQAARDNGVKPGSLLAYGISYFIRRLKADPSILKFENKRELHKG